MKRIGRGHYSLGHFEVSLESKGKWRVWDISGDRPTPLEAFPSLRESAAYCRNELCLEEDQGA